MQRFMRLAILGGMLWAVGSGLRWPGGVSVRAAPDRWPAGDTIARRINAQDDGETVSYTLEMTLIDRHGKTRVRETVGFRKDDGAERRLVLFYLRPRNVRDTAFLTLDYAEAERDDDQWLYLPALRKVRRISAANRGDYFLGTDFTYEDIKLGNKVSLTDYTRTTVGEDTVDGQQCYVLEEVPVNDEVAHALGYGRVRRWVDRTIWISRRAAFWDLRGNPLKTIHTRDIRQVQGIWTAHRIEVENHKTGHRTVFTFSAVDYTREVTDDLFTQRALRRGWR